MGKIHLNADLQERVLMIVMSARAQKERNQSVDGV